MSAANGSVFEALRNELPKCARHPLASRIDCGECMYLSTKIYAPLEVIENALREIGTPKSPGEGFREGRLLAEWWQHTACKRGEIARDALGVTAEELILDANA